MAFFRLPLSDADEGIIVTGAERILRGQVPYRDFFSELGPASFYLQALIFKLSAVHVTAVRVPVWLLGGTISGLIYGTSRQIMRETGAAIATCIFTLVCYPITYSLSHHWWALLFLFLVVLCLKPGGLQAARVLPRGRLLVAGALASSTLLAMQP
jgi:4-amino-4-deoxy-L-arabinose transferase-like glycosyltransferase